MRDSELPPNRRTKRTSELPPEPEAIEPEVESGEVDETRRKGRAGHRVSTGRRLALGRWFKRLQLLTGIMVVVGTSVLVAWGLQRYLRSSPRFSIRVVKLDGAGRRTPQQLLKRAGIAEGLNIFKLDLEQARAALAADPWLESAKVDKELPTKVTIKVVEREARALLALEGKLYLVDGNAVVFKELADGEPHDLPVMTGVEPKALKRDREGVTLQMRRAIELMADLEDAKIAKRYPLQELHLHNDGGVDVVVGSDAIVLSMGNPPYRSKMGKARRILSEMRHRKVKPAVLFLDNTAHPERVVVRMR